MVHGDRGRETRLRAVTRIALGHTRRDRNVRGRLAFRGAPVVAGIAGSGTHRVGRRVGKHHRQPAGRRTMTTFAGGHAHVCRRVGFAHSRRETAVMTARALRAHGDVAVKTGWRPRRKPTLVAAVAIGNGHAAERLVGNVVCSASIGRRKGSAVTGRTLVDHGHLGMVEPAGPPGAGGMAADAVGHAHGNMCSRLARRRGAVVATRTVGGHRERAVVHQGRTPVPRGLVAGFAIGCHAGMDARVGLAADMAGRTLITHHYSAVEPGRRPAREARLVAGIAVGDCHSADPVIGRMGGRPAIRWRICTAVARGTLVGHRDLGVVEPGRFPRGGGMAAGATGRPHRNMRARFPGCRSSIMTTRAVRRCAERAVVRPGRVPVRCRSVARIARGLGWDMPGMLAFGYRAVVTACARTRRNSHVIEPGPHERSGVMAAVTGLLRWDVRRGDDHIAASDSVAADVATGTVPGCASEHPIDMTGLALGRNMNPRQRKASLQMIEQSPRNFGLGQCMCTHEHESERKNPPHDG